MSYPGIQISRLGGQLFLCPKNFSALTRDIGNIGNCIFFFAEQKKNQTNGAAGEKKIRARCKNLAFSAQSHTANPFLRSKKGKMAPQAKKKLRYSLDGAVSNPVPMVLPWFNTTGFFFFFFFFQTSVAPQQNFIR